jgi:hypothetical protein
VIVPDHEADRLAGVLTGKDVSPGSVASLLEKIALYEDEQHWRESILDDYSLDVRFRQESMAGGRLLIEVPDLDLLRDPRIVPVVRRALEFKKRDGATVSRGEHQRLSIKSESLSMPVSTVGASSPPGRSPSMSSPSLRRLALLLESSWSRREPRRRLSYPLTLTASMAVGGRTIFRSDPWQELTSTDIRGR